MTSIRLVNNNPLSRLHSLHYYIRTPNFTDKRPVSA